MAYGWLSRQHAQAGTSDEAPRLGRVGLAVLLGSLKMEPPAHKAGACLSLAAHGVQCPGPLNCRSAECHRRHAAKAEAWWPHKQTTCTCGHLWLLFNW